MLLFFVLTSCADFGGPVKMRQNFIPVDTTTIEAVCEELSSSFPGYDCVQEFERPFEFVSEAETVEITLTRETLLLKYETTDDNGPLFKTYERVITAIK